MAIFHLSMKAIQRSAGRSAVASAAYRSGDKLHDPRQNLTFSYIPETNSEANSKIADRIKSKSVFLPDGSTMNRQELWGSVELHHKRKDACTAREIEIALPHDLPEPDRIRLAEQFGKLISETYKVATDVCVHTSEGEGDNWHAHIMATTATIENRKLGKKAKTFDPHDCAMEKIQKPADFLRPIWEKMINDELEKIGSMNRVTHKSYAELDRPGEPQKHIGPNRKTNALRKEIAQLKKELAEEAKRENEVPEDLKQIMKVWPEISQAQRQAIVQVAKEMKVNFMNLEQTSTHRMIYELGRIVAKRESRSPEPEDYGYIWKASREVLSRSPQTLQKPLDRHRGGSGYDDGR